MRNCLLVVGSIILAACNSGSGGSVQAIEAGDGLSGSGGEVVSLAVDFGGSGTAKTVAHSDHLHAGTYLPVGATLSCPAGSLVASVDALTGDVSCQAAYDDTRAVAAMGARSDTNALHHDRYTDLEAVIAMGAKSNTNALNHDRYTDAEAVIAMGAKSNSNAFNHDRYTDAEAITAMGPKANTNPLHHDRYTDADALAAIAASGAGELLPLSNEKQLLTPFLSNSGTTATPNDHWQSFTVRQTGELSSIKVNYVQGASTVTFVVYRGEGTMGPQLSSQTVTLVAGWNTLFPASIVKVNRGEKYTFRISAASDVRLRHSSADAYPFGIASLSSGMDLAFEAQTRATLLLASPNGNCWALRVNDTGVLSTVFADCPAN